MKTSRLLGIVIVLQAMLLLSQWVGPSLSTVRADTELPNPGERQLAILDELKTLNGKMDHLTGLLQSGQLEVRVTRVQQK